MQTMVKLQAKYEQLLQYDSSAISMFRPLREMDLNNILLPVDMTSQFKLSPGLDQLEDYSQGIFRLQASN